MTSTLKLSLGLCAVLLLGACGSSPVSNFYRLTPEVTPAEGAVGPSLGIGPIDVPEFLNRNALVYTRDGNQLQVSAQDRWAEPLQYGVQRVVAINLSHLMETEDIRFFPWDVRRAPDYGLRVNLLDLDARDGEAVLVVDWVLYRPADGTAIQRRISQFSRPLSSTGALPSELPAAYSTLFFEFTETVAEAIRIEMAATTETDVDA